MYQQASNMKHKLLCSKYWLILEINNHRKRKSHNFAHLFKNIRHDKLFWGAFHKENSVILRILYMFRWRNIRHSWKIPKKVHKFYIVSTQDMTTKVCLFFKKGYFSNKAIFRWKNGRRNLEKKWSNLFASQISRCH